jgi:hypothetical protein
MGSGAAAEPPGFNGLGGAVAGPGSVHAPEIGGRGVLPTFHAPEPGVPEPGAPTFHAPEPGVGAPTFHASDPVAGVARPAQGGGGGGGGRHARARMAG